MFFSQHFSFPLSVSFHHCSILIHPFPPTLYNFSLPAIEFSPVSIIPPLLHTHSSIYHPRCIIFFSQYFIFPCQYHSTIAPYSFINLPPTLYNVFLPVLQFSPVSIIPPLLHTHSLTYHPRCIIFFSQYFSFPRSLSLHHCPILIHPPTSHGV